MTKNNYHSRSHLTLALLFFFTAQLTTIETFEFCRQVRRSEIICGVKGSSTISISYFPDVKITCSRLESLEYSHLPRLNIGSIDTVSILNCPLSPMLPINTIFRKLGVTEVNTLLFKWGGPLQRLHFDGLQDLDNLKLSSTNLSNLPEDLFVDLKKLTWLDLNSNNVQLTLNIFSSLENVKFLQLDNNKLHNLQPGIFRNQKKLIYLNLKNNNLKNLTKTNFEGGSSIIEVDLSANKIVTLPRDVFSFLTKIFHINLNENYLESLPEGLFEMNKYLSSFKLYDNQVPLKQLPQKLLANLPHLLDVRLSCGLETIPEDLFANSTVIRTITISKNNLTQLPPKLFVDQIELFDLDLSRNQLNSLPDEIFQNNRNLRNLRLSHNHLVNITNGIFSTLIDLQVLYVDNNNLFTIYPDAFVNTAKLMDIYMENNYLQLSEDPSGKVTPFHYLTELHTLNLKNNSIRGIFDEWKFANSKIRMLDLSYNKITMVTHCDLLHVNSGRFTNFSHNSIQKIDFNLYDDGYSLKKNVVVDLSNNPVYCDCDILAFVQFVKQQARLTGFLKIIVDHLQCGYPTNLQGRIVSQLSSIEFLCPTAPADGIQSGH